MVHLLLLRHLWQAPEHSCYRTLIVVVREREREGEREGERGKDGMKENMRLGSEKRIASLFINRPLHHFICLPRVALNLIL